MRPLIKFEYVLDAGCAPPPIHRPFEIVDGVISVDPLVDGHGGNFDSLDEIPAGVNIVRGRWLRRADRWLAPTRTYEELVMDVASFCRSVGDMSDDPMTDGLIEVLGVERRRYSIDLVLDVLAGFRRIDLVQRGAKASGPIDQLLLAALRSEAFVGVVTEQSSNRSSSGSLPTA